MTCARFGEDVAAAVRARTPVEVAELQSFCQSRLARFKVPRHLRFVEEFPLTASGKVQKFRLRESHEKMLR